MTRAEPGENRLFRWADQLPAALWDDLDARSPDQAVEACEAQWSQGVYLLPLLGRPYLVDANTRQVREADRPDHRVSYQAGLVLVTHLARALGVPPVGRMVTPQELPGGTLFFTGAHAVNTKDLEASFGSDPQALIRRATAMGGGPAEAGGDLAVAVSGLPRLPLFVLLWVADEEFPARAVVGLDAHAHHQMDLGGVWALTNLLVSRLCVEE